MEERRRREEERRQEERRGEETRGAKRREREKERTEQPNQNTKNPMNSLVDYGSVWCLHIHVRILYHPVVLVQRILLLPWPPSYVHTYKYFSCCSSPGTHGVKATTTWTGIGKWEWIYVYMHPSLVPQEDGIRYNDAGSLLFPVSYYLFRIWYLVFPNLFAYPSQRQNVQITLHVL